MKFEEALAQLREGVPMARASWVDSWLVLNASGLFLGVPGGGLHSVTVTQDDILAEDWADAREKTPEAVTAAEPPVSPEAEPQPAVTLAERVEDAIKAEFEHIAEVVQEAIEPADQSTDKASE